ncbi:MAG TPA: hypothetical protein VG817_08240 [Gemmatimonadales bacterium]|nr:hypothetical protein [Gemmatimonadales bacterium]
MATDRLATYLSDHLAGSVSAAELVERLRRSDLDTSLAAALGQVAESISRHQDILRDLLAQRGRDEHQAKNLAAWLAEKFSRPAMPVKDDDEFGLLRALEALILGMRGRVAMWQALEAIEPSHPELIALDAHALCLEAEDQLRMMDRHRLEVARIALRGWGDG